jgi:two-component system LytT family response regulator
MKIRAIIVDDEPDSRESIKLMVTQFYNNEIEIIDSVSSVKEAVRSINSFKPDLVFLDIEMPNENGFQLFEYFGNDYNFEVVFITAFQEYALSAFRYAALDYLLKPVDYKQLGEAIQRFKKTDYHYSKLRIDTYLNNLTNDLEISKTILLPAKNGYNIVKINSILYCKADGNYSNVYTQDGKSFLLTTLLKNLEERLPDSIFFRTHKSFLVNLNYVKKVDKAKNLIFLENDKVVEIASRRINEFEKVLKSI